MSDLADSNNDNEAANLEAFKAGVRDVSELPVIFVNTRELDDHPQAEAGEVLRRQLDEQVPGISANLTGQELDALGRYYRGSMPRGASVEIGGTQYAIVNTPNEFYDEAHEIAATLAKTAPERLRAVPGDDRAWNRALGIHEGSHPHQEFNRAAAGEARSVVTLEREADADRAVIADLERSGEAEMAQAWRDYRALGAPFDAEHATSPLLDDETPASQSNIEAARNLETEMAVAVGARLGIDVDQADDMMESDPGRFFSEVDEALENGAFADRPELQQYVGDYSGAYQRQMVMPEGGTPTIMEGSVRDEMRIGGVSASSYFSSHADPALAQQRLEQAGPASAIDADYSQRPVAPPLSGPG